MVSTGPAARPTAVAKPFLLHFEQFGDGALRAGDLSQRGVACSGSWRCSRSTRSSPSASRLSSRERRAWAASNRLVSGSRSSLVERTKPWRKPAALADHGSRSAPRCARSRSCGRYRENSPGLRRRRGRSPSPCPHRHRSHRYRACLRDRRCRNKVSRRLEWFGLRRPSRPRVLAWFSSFEIPGRDDGAWRASDVQRTSCRSASEGLFR